MFCPTYKALSVKLAGMPRQVLACSQAGVSRPCSDLALKHCTWGHAWLLRLLISWRGLPWAWHRAVCTASRSLTSCPGSASDRLTCRTNSQSGLELECHTCLLACLLACRTASWTTAGISQQDPAAAVPACDEHMALALPAADMWLPIQEHSRTCRLAGQEPGRKLMRGKFKVKLPCATRMAVIPRGGFRGRQICSPIAVSAPPGLTRLASTNQTMSR